MRAFFTSARTGSRYLAAMAAPVVVTASSSLQGAASAPGDPSQAIGGDKAHHKKGGGFVNPWDSFRVRSFSPASSSNPPDSEPLELTSTRPLIALQDPGRGPSTLWNAYKSWETHPVPSADLLPQRRQPDFAPPPSLSPDERDAWYADLKTTWLGHACFLVEFPAGARQAGQEGEERRGFRVLFDPVWSHRCSPSQCASFFPSRRPEYLVRRPDAQTRNRGRPSPCHQAARRARRAATCRRRRHLAQPLCVPLHLFLDHVQCQGAQRTSDTTSSLALALADDHLDIPTLKKLYHAQPAGSIHFFAPLGNKEWFQSNIGVADTEVTELDWWEERELRVGGGGEAAGASKGDKLRVVCTPCQHFTGRSLTDRNDTLWASWSVQSSVGGKVWFGGTSLSLFPSSSRISQSLSELMLPPRTSYAGDTGYRTVPRAPHDLSTLPVCPEFKRIGEREGPHDLGMIPIGAYDPRWLFSSVHCAPEDSVELHRETRCKKSIGASSRSRCPSRRVARDAVADYALHCAHAGMHWATWQLTPEEARLALDRLSSTPPLLTS